MRRGGRVTREGVVDLFRELQTMGKGDKRTKRGKLFKGTFGKRRLKPQAAAKKAKAAAAAQS
jgi:30S ribosomal protein S31